MDEKQLEKTLRKVNRQLRSIKALLAFFALLILCMFVLVGYVAYRVVSFTNDAETKITNIQKTTEQKLDIKSQLCNGSSNNAVTEQFCN